jgi:hypothetical protein
LPAGVVVRETEGGFLLFFELFRAALDPSLTLKRLSQKKFAEQLGIDFTTLAGWERGEQAVSTDVRKF